MKIVPLNESQVARLYPCLEEAFPPDELKPLYRILLSMKQDAYDALGLMEEDKLLGYAFFVKTKQHVLLDYFSVLPEFRGQGIGAAFLQLLSAYCRAAESVLVEVEDPAYAETQPQHQMQQRRLTFYLRNGFFSTGVQVFVFGVHYLLLGCHAEDTHDPERIKALYRAHYRAMLPANLYERNIHI